MGVAGLIVLALAFGAGQVREALTVITAQSVLILFSLQLATLLAGAWIWHFLLSRNSRISFGTVFLINQAAALVESLTPSVKLGGEAAKIYLLRKKTCQPLEGLAGVMLVHKFLTMSPFALLCLLLLAPGLFYFDLPWVFYVSLAGLVLICLVLGLICYRLPSSSSPKTIKPARAELSRLKKFFSKAGLFLAQARISASGLLDFRQTMGVFTVSLAIWILYPVKVYLACSFLGMDVHPVVIGLATVFAYMISMIPIFPGGLGSYEGGMTLLFTLGGLSPAEGLAIALVSRLTTFWFPLLLSAGSCLVLLREDSLALHRSEPDQSTIQA